MKQKEEKLMIKIKVVRKDNSNSFKVFAKNATLETKEKIMAVAKDLTAECIKQNEKEMTATIVVLKKERN